MHKQDDPALNPIGKWGCYFTSMVNMVEDETGNVRSKKAVILLFLNALRAGWVDEEATVLFPDELLKSMGSSLRLKTKADVPLPLPQTLPGEYEILKFAKPGHEHFVLGDGLGKIVFDPMTDHDMTPYRLVGKRIYRKV